MGHAETCCFRCVSCLTLVKLNLKMDFLRVGYACLLTEDEEQLPNFCASSFFLGLGKVHTELVSLSTLHTARFVYL